MNLHLCTSNNITSLLGKQNQSRRNNSKQPHLEDTADVNDNQCCVCFDEYMEGETWFSVHIVAGYMRIVPLMLYWTAVSSQKYVQYA